VTYYGPRITRNPTQVLERFSSPKLLRRDESMQVDPVTAAKIALKERIASNALRHPPKKA